jgi:hypothetical protein
MVLSLLLLAQVSTTVCGKTEPPDSILESFLTECVDGYVIPPFDANTFRAALLRVKDAGVVLRLFERVDRELGQVKAESMAFRRQLQAMPEIPKDGAEQEKRRVDGLRKRIAICDRQMETLDLINLSLMGTLNGEASEESLLFMLGRYSKFSPRLRAYVLEVAGVHATPKHAEAISQLFLKEQDLPLLDRFPAALARVGTPSDAAVARLCALGSEVNRSRRFRHACMKTVVQVGNRACLPQLRALLDDEVVGYEAYQAFRRISGVDPYEQ